MTSLAVIIIVTRAIGVAEWSTWSIIVEVEVRRKIWTYRCRGSVKERVPTVLVATARQLRAVESVIE